MILVTKPGFGWDYLYSFSGVVPGFGVGLYREGFERFWSSVLVVKLGFEWVQSSTCIGIKFEAV